MKLPFAKDDDSKRMMSGTSNGRNELLYEAREMSVTGNAVQKRSVHRHTQIEPNMDLGSGDTPDYSIDIGNHREPYVEEKSFSLVESEREVRTYETQTPPYERVASYDAARVTQGVQSGEYYVAAKPSHPFRSSENLHHAAIVEDNHQPNFMARESNPSIPSPTEHSKMSTLTMSDRSRRATDADDDIEKVDDADQDKSVARRDSGLKTSATTNEKLPDSEKADEHPQWPEDQMTDENTSCPVQCLYYTIECCECIIL